MLWRGSALASLVLREVAKISDFGRRESFFEKLPQAHCLKSAIRQPPHNEGAKAACGRKHPDKL